MAGTTSPGKRTLTQRLGPPVRRKAADDASSPPAAAEGPPKVATIEDADQPLEADPAAATAAEQSLIGDAGDYDDTEARPGNQPPDRGERGGGQPGASLDAVLHGSAGRPLPEPLREELEARAGMPLAHVRVHDDAAAGAATVELSARAFTRGDDVYFAPGQYAPETAEGRKLVAHEVLHTLQPQQAEIPRVTEPGDGVEREADDFAERFAEEARQDDVVEDSDASGSPAVDAPARAEAPRTAVPRFPGVVPEAFAEDKARFIDPRNEALGKVWEPGRGYIKNSSAQPLGSLIKNGKVGGGFENGTFMYVVDGNGEVIVGKRLGQQMPHPTLVGGLDPQIKAAGMVKIQGGKIVAIDNHSGHFRPPRGALGDAVKSFVKLPKQAFKNFSAESVHFDGGVESRRAFNSLRLLKLKSFNPGKAINRIKLRYRHDPRFRGGLKNAGKAGLAIIATLVAEYFIGKWMAEAEAEQVRKEIERLAPKVEAELLRSLEEKAELFDKLHETSPGTTVYLNVVYRLVHVQAHHAAGGQVASADAFAGLELKSADVSLGPVDEGISSSGQSMSCIGTMTRYHDYAMSESIKLSDLYDDAAPAPTAAGEP